MKFVDDYVILCNGGFIISFPHEGAKPFQYVGLPHVSLLAYHAAFGVLRVAGAEVSKVGGKVHAIHGGDFSQFEDEVVRFGAMLKATVTV
ncbi:MAG: hypothetical protein GY696_19440 [Gammaproteobacteria bacterium]|nr:hypothetical protein [Gammaproteobacteria bacterium]